MDKSLIVLKSNFMCCFAYKNNSLMYPLKVTKLFFETYG